MRLGLGTVDGSSRNRCRDRWRVRDVAAKTCARGKVIRNCQSSALRDYDVVIFGRWWSRRSRARAAWAALVRSQNDMRDIENARRSRGAGGIFMGRVS